jgi:phospholipase/lecithinase/hemolysin
MKSRRFTQVVLVAVSLAFLVSAGYAQPYTEVYVFGESLLDAGNAKAAWWTLLGIEIIPSPPYAEGRFCNGPVFPDVIAENLGLGPVEASVNGGTNYGFGGARSVVDYLYWGVLPVPSVRSQIEEYLTDVGGVADPDALYILQDGGNDTGFAFGVFAATDDWDAAAAVMEESALGMIESLQMLADAGAVHFVVPSGPHYSSKPRMCGQAVADSLMEYYNTMLETGLAGLNGDLHILYVDVYGFMKVVADHFITCIRCVSMSDPTVPECSNPDELMYWDEVHPSAPVQQLIGDAVTVAMLKDKVLQLTGEGVLKAGNSNALLVKLDGAYRKLEDSKGKTAANKMRAFANQVEAFVQTGKLSAEQAELLLVGAYGIIDQP